MKILPVVVLLSVFTFLSACGGGNSGGVNTGSAASQLSNSTAPVSERSQISVSSVAQQASSEVVSSLTSSAAAAKPSLQGDWYFEDDFPLVLRMQGGSIVEYRLFPPYGCYNIRNYTVDKVDSDGMLEYTRAVASGAHYSASYKISGNALTLYNSHLTIAQGSATLTRNDQVLVQYVACENADRKGSVKVTLEFLASPQNSTMANADTDVLSTDYLAEIGFDINHNGKYDTGDLSLTVEHVITQGEISGPWDIGKLNQYLTVNFGGNNNFGYSLNFASVNDRWLTFTVEKSVHPAIAAIDNATQVFVRTLSEVGSIKDDSDADYKDYFPAKDQFTKGLDTHLLEDLTEDVIYSTDIASLPKPVATRGDIDLVSVVISITDE